MRFSVYAGVVNGKKDSRYMRFPLNILHLCGGFKNINKSYLKTFYVSLYSLCLEEVNDLAHISSRRFI